MHVAHSGAAPPGTMHPKSTAMRSVRSLKSVKGASASQFVAAGAPTPGVGAGEGDTGGGDDGGGAEADVTRLPLAQPIAAPAGGLMTDPDCRRFLEEMRAELRASVQGLGTELRASVAELKVAMQTHSRVQ